MMLRSPIVDAMHGNTPTFNRTVVAIKSPVLEGWLSYIMRTMPPDKRTMVVEFRYQ